MMSKSFHDGKVDKLYWAIVRGWIHEDSVLDYVLTNDEGVTQSAVTEVRPLHRTEIDFPFGGHQTSRYTLTSLLPKTGRFHQLRKHMAHLRHPIIGDRPHGCHKQNKLWKETWSMTDMMLHAKELHFQHPHTNNEIVIKAPLSDSFEKGMGIVGLKFVL